MSIAEKQIKVKKENKKLKTKQKKSKKPPKNKTKQKKPTKIKREMKLIVPALSPILLWIEYYSIMWLIGRRLFNNFSLLELVNSFSSSLIFLIVFFKLSKYSCFVFLACKYRIWKLVTDDLLALRVGYCRIFLLWNSAEWRVGCL